MRNGTFVDYYDLLKISSAADAEMLEAAVRVGLARYHPTNDNTGDKQKFELVKSAYLTLSNPQARAAFDREYKMQGQNAPREVSGSITTEDIEAEREKRRQILLVLYSRIRERSHDAGVTVPQISESLGQAPDELHFSFWFLRERKRIARTENGSFRITADGVEWVEDHVIPSRAENPAADAEDSDAEEDGKSTPITKSPKRAQTPVEVLNTTAKSSVG